MAAITRAGGFTDAAWQARVLVVRGSLESPKRFIVSVKDILAGKERGFRLEPNDIVYVSDHPWAKVEDLSGPRHNGVLANDGDQLDGRKHRLGGQPSNFTEPPMRYTLICLLAMLVVCSGCQTAKIKPKKLPLARGVQTIAQTNIDNRVDPALLALPVEPYRLGPGDVIKVEMPQISGSGERTTVGPDGKVYYSIIAGVNVWGMTLSEAKAAMEKGLEALYRRPVVSVTLVTVESQRFWILGRVKSPGSYPLATPTTLLEAIAGANGFETTFSAGSTEEVADVKHSFVVRDGNMLPVNFTHCLRET